MDVKIIKELSFDSSEAISKLCLQIKDDILQLVVTYKNSGNYSFLVCNQDTFEIIELVITNQSKQLIKEAADYLEETWPSITITKKNTSKISIGATIHSLIKNKYIEKIQIDK